MDLDELIKLVIGIIIFLVLLFGAYYLLKNLGVL
jgi:hypothetical protein